MSYETQTRPLTPEEEQYLRRFTEKKGSPLSDDFLSVLFVVLPSLSPTPVHDLSSNNQKLPICWWGAHFMCQFATLLEVLPEEVFAQSLHTANQNRIKASLEVLKRKKDEHR